VAQLSQAEIAEGLLDDPRVTAIGMHIEGFTDLRAWERLAAKAHMKGIPIVALKVGTSEQARQAAVSHTASLAGHDSGAQALLDRLGIARCDDLAVFIETLKLLHYAGPLPSNQISSVSCSGGEASLCADLAHAAGLSFPALEAPQRTALSKALGEKVALANPLDYHTYIWRDADKMAQAWRAMVLPQVALTMFIVDFPRADTCDPTDWDCAIEAAIQVKSKTPGHVAMVSSLPELMPEPVAARLAAAGVIPLNGLADGVQAAATAIARQPQDAPLLLPGDARDASLLTEAEAKRALWAYGLAVPKAVLLEGREDMDQLFDLAFPVAAKVLGLAHKTDANGIALRLTDQEAAQEALRHLAPGPVLIEEMVEDVIAELLVGVIRDPAHGFVLTIGAGGTLAELWQDTACLLVPASEAQINEALDGLRIGPLLNGYRGKPPADRKAILEAIQALQAYVSDHADSLEELEINPLLCTASEAIAVDALIRKTP